MLALSRGRRIALSDLLVATGHEQRDLWDLRRRGLFPFTPEHAHIAGRRGSASDYPIDALDYLRRLADVQRQFPRKADEWVWRMWLDPANWPIDMRAWMLAHLDRALNRTIRKKTEGAVLRPGAEDRVMSASRVRNRENRRTASEWMFAWALGNERPDLYLALPETASKLNYFDLLLRAAGAPFENLPVYSFSGRREQVSKRGGPYLLAHFRRIVALAPARHIEQARRDWRLIAELVELAERVDWNQVPSLTAVGAKPEPPSWTARKARRVRRRPPPDFIRNAIKEWRDRSSYLALLFASLLIARRLYSRRGMPQLPDIMITIARQWLEGLPKIEAEGGEHEASHARR